MLGLRATARALGIDHAQLKRLADNGQVPRNNDGFFDPEAVRKALAANVDPAFSRKPAVKKGGDKGGDKSPRRHQSPVTTTEDALEAITLVARVLAEEGVANDGPLDLPGARLAETILKARDRDLRIAERRQVLVPKDKVTAHIASAFLGFRRAIEGMPARHAAEMAAKLGCSPAALDAEMRRVIHATLTELSAPLQKA